MKKRPIGRPSQLPPTVEVVIEIPRGSFLKRGSDGRIDFVSPLPCPYNYGSIHQYIGGEGDYLDAVVLGPRLSAGSTVVINAYGAVGLSERFMYDDKVICAIEPITASQRLAVLRFFHLYAACKGVLNLLRGRRGRSRCEGWGEAEAAIARAVPVEAGQRHPRIKF
jgi:inorganic pyrophosphatase